MRTNHFDLADRAFGGGLAQWLSRMRAQGTPYWGISKALQEDHGVSIPSETLRRWCIRLDLNPQPETEGAA